MAQQSAATLGIRFLGVHHRRLFMFLPLGLSGTDWGGDLPPSTRNERGGGRERDEGFYQIPRIYDELLYCRNLMNSCCL